MKKILIALLILAVVCGVAWFVLLRPETLSQDTITADFETNRKAYEDVASYLREKHITAEITKKPKEGQEIPGIAAEQSAEYTAFTEGVSLLLSDDHDAIISDGETVEFVYHSTGGVFVKLYGSVIYNGAQKVDGKITVPLTTDGWHLFIAKE